MVSVSSLCVRTRPGLLDFNFVRLDFLSFHELLLSRHYNPMEFRLDERFNNGKPLLDRLQGDLLVAVLPTCSLQASFSRYGSLKLRENNATMEREEKKNG